MAKFVAVLSKVEAALKSHNLIIPLEEENINKLGSVGWKEALVITSLRSSIFSTGISTTE